MEQILKRLEEDPEKHLKKIETKKLVKILEAASDYYYNNEQILSDETYDFLERELKKRDSLNPYFQKIGAPIREDIVKVELPFWMGSLDKIYPDTREYEIWFEKHSPPYFVTEKLDGFSGLIEYDETGKIKIYTRGDGNIGQDISFLSDYLRIPKKVKNKVIRGEFIMRKSIFMKKYEKKYPKARSAVGSIVNAKKPELDIINDIEFLAYEMVEEDGQKWSSQFNNLNKIGFSTPDSIVYPKLTERDLLEIYKDWEKISDYAIDGLVISEDRNYERYTSGNPKYSVAFKVNSEGKKTTVQEVLWAVSKHGTLKPRVKFDPIILDGDVVNYATAFNAKFVEENDLGPGSVIKVAKGGGVIPDIVSIVKRTKPQFPQEKYYWNETHVDIILDDLKNSDDYKKKRILHFFQTLKIPNVSIGILGKLYDKKIDTPYKICTVTIEQLLGVSGLREKSSQKIYDSIHSIIDYPIPLERIMTASLAFDNGFGEKRLGLILEKYPNFMKIYQKLKTEDIETIDGFSEKTSKAFSKHIPDFIKFIQKMPFLKIKKESKKQGEFTDKIVVFSGFRNKEIKEKIENMGGKVADTVTSKTTYLVIKNEDEAKTSKVKKAESLNIIILTLEEFKKL